MADIVKSGCNEIVDQVGEIKGMHPDEISELTVSVVETTRNLSAASDELDFLSGALDQLNEVNESYQRKAKKIKRKITDFATRL